MHPVSRPVRARLSITATVLFLLAACAPSTGTSTTQTTTQVEDDPVTTTTVPPTSPDDEPPCSAGPQPFVESGGGGVIERDDSDASIVSGIRWTTFDTCVRVVVEFAATSGAPAVTPPGVGPLFIRTAGVLRLQLDPVVSQSSILDQVIDGGLVSRAFIVRRPTDDLFIDFHLTEPALVRVSAASGPARLIVDFVEGGDRYSAPAIVTDDLVVVDPVGGTLIYPFTVNGYLRDDSDTMTVTISVGDIEETYSSDVGARSDTWGAFTVLVPDGPDGLGSMVVGETPLTVDLS